MEIIKLFIILITMLMSFINFCVIIYLIKQLGFVFNFIHEAANNKINISNLFKSLVGIPSEGENDS